MIQFLFLLLCFAIGFLLATNEDFLRGLILYLRIDRYDTIKITRTYANGDEVELIKVIDRGWNDVRLSSSIRGIADWDFKAIGEMLHSSTYPFKHTLKYSYEIIKNEDDA